MPDKLTPDNIKDVKKDAVVTQPAELPIDTEKPLDRAPQETKTVSPEFLVPESMLAQATVADPYKESVDMKRHAMKVVLDAQPKVMTMIPPEPGADPRKPEYYYVGINGYPLWIMRGVFVAVPQQVAELIKESFHLTYAVGKDKLVDSSQARLDALS